MKALDKEILRLALPSILANITVPLVGMVDIAVAGHLHGAYPSAACIGGISVGALLLNVIYWNCFFIRASTGGLTAQAYGRRNAAAGATPDIRYRHAQRQRKKLRQEFSADSMASRAEQPLTYATATPGPAQKTPSGALRSVGVIADSDRQSPGGILRQSLQISAIMATLLLVLQWPLSRLTFIFADETPRVAELALRYFFIRIWAAPATIALMALKGWFIGMQDSVSSMLTDLIVNVVNIAASIVLSLGIAGWSGIGFDGIALGTVVAQYCGLAFAAAVVAVKYRGEFRAAGQPLTSADAGATPDIRYRLAQGQLKKLRQEFSAASDPDGSFRRLFTLNGDLFVRSLCFTGIYLGFTVIAAQYGETLLACCNIMMTLLMLFSYFTDGFAYAGEALTGRFIGERNPEMTSHAVGRTFLWSLGVAGVWMIIYWIGGLPMLRLMTDDATVVDACRQFLPWLLIMPLFGCAAFTWDGIYIGATSSRAIRNAMIVALAAFLGVWFAGKALLGATGLPVAAGNDVYCIHLLMAAYFAHLLARAVVLTYRWRRRIL